MTPDQATAGGPLVPLTPQRILDTRIALGASGKVTSLNVPMAGRFGIPAVGAAAVSINITVTGPVADGWLAASPVSSPATTSNINFRAGQTIAASAIVPLSADGRILLTSLAATDVVLDLTGYFATPRAATGGLYNPVTSARIVDTRLGLGAAGRLAPGSTTVLPIAGHGGVPLTGVAAVALNITVTAPSGPGWIAGYPSGSGSSGTSSINFVEGQTIANRLIVPVGANGAIDLLNSVGESTDLVVDVNGWFTSSGSAVGGAGYLARIPTRVSDSRPGPGYRAGESDRVNYHSNDAPVSFDSSVAAVAAVATITVIGDGPGFVQSYPGDGPASGTALVPSSSSTSSDVNFVSGVPAANLALLPVQHFCAAQGCTADTTIIAFGAAHTAIIVDVSGYLVEPSGRSGAYHWGDQDATLPVYSQSGIAQPVQAGPARLSSQVRAITASPESVELITMADGHVWQFSAALPQPLAPVPGIDDAVMAAAAGSLSTTGYALRSDGTVYAWGANGSGQAGQPAPTKVLLPTTVPGLTDVVSIAAGDFAAYAVRSDGTVLSWGDARYGQLGDAEGVSRSSPEQIPGLTGIEKVFATGRRAYAIDNTGAVWSWGTLAGSAGPLAQTESTPVRIHELTDVTSVAFALTVDAFLHADGSATTSADTTYAQSIPGFSALTALVGNRVGFYGLTQNGLVVCAPVDRGQTFPVRGDGTVDGLAPSPGATTVVAGLSGATVIGAAYMGVTAVIL
jgi:hypothetical protein